MELVELVRYAHDSFCFRNFHFLCYHRKSGFFLSWNSPFLCRFTFIPSFETALRLPGDVSLMTSSHKIKA